MNISKQVILLERASYVISSHFYCPNTRIDINVKYVIENKLIAMRDFGAMLLNIVQLIPNLLNLYPKALSLKFEKHT